MVQEIIIPVLTLLCGGGFGWLFTMRATRKKADADAMKAVQEVYQQTIADLQSNITEVRRDRDEMREEKKQLQSKLDKLEDDIRDLRNAVARNGRKVDAMRPFLCGKVDCTLRIPVMGLNGGTEQ